jgi:hypothetical protein
LKEKEYLYVGYYYDSDNNFILKVGTTNDLERRRKEHTRNYRRAKKHTMPKEQMFEYLWSKPLSKYNTLRYEDQTRENWKNLGIGTFIRNDRFVCDNPPTEVEITIRKKYKIRVDK